VIEFESLNIEELRFHKAELLRLKGVVLWNTGKIALATKDF